MQFFRKAIGTWVIAAAFGALAVAQSPGPQADASLPLFTAIAAAVAADAGGTQYNSALAQQLRKDLAGKEIPSLDEIKTFLNLNHADYTHLVSFGLVIEGPPDFRFRYREADLPIDAQALIGLNALLSAFYREANLDDLWGKYRPIYEDQAAIYQESIARVMLEVNGYLRNPSSGFYGRNFSVYIDMLGPPNEVNARSFETDYYVVVTSSQQLRSDEVRHGYLHYILEPLAAKESIIVRSKNQLEEIAKTAPALDRGLRRSFPLFMTESLIRAVELRMSKVKTDDLARRVAENAVEGYFLVPYFVEALLQFEQQDSGIRIYYPTMIENMNVIREEARAKRITFRTTASPRALSESADARASTPTGDDVESLLASGEDALARKDVPAARKSYQLALDKATNDPEATSSARARALYGLAIAATEAKQGEVAKTFFQQTLDIAREPKLLAWSHIYLGRLLDMENRREAAVRHYKQALETGDTSASVKQAAQKGIDTPFTKQ